MAWQIAAAIAFGGMQAGAQKAAGAAAYRDSLRQAAEIRKQRFDIEELAAQQHVDRMMSFSDLQRTNNAYAAFMGRSDRSIAALRNEEARRYGRDVDRIREQERREGVRINREAEETIRQGQIANRQYKSAARTTMFNTFASAAMMYSAPTGGGTTTPNTIGGGTGYKSVMDNPLAPKTQLAF